MLLRLLLLLLQVLVSCQEVCGHFKRLKDNPFNDPGVTCYFLLSSLQRLPSLRIVVLICSSRLVLVVKGRFTRGPPSRHHDNRPDSNLVESSILERGLEG